MPEPENPPKPKPWRPRFSLRTLMIGVFLIASLWNVTFLWGVPGMKHHFSPRAVEFKVLAPFVIHCKYNGPRESIDETWIWFFGYTRRWSGRHVIACW